MHNVDVCGMLEEDSAARQSQHADLRDTHNALEAKMAEFKETFKEELQLFFDELKLEEDLTQVRMVKADIEGKLRASERLRLTTVHKLEVNDQLAAKLQTELATNEVTTKEAAVQGLEELQTLERTLDKKIAEVDSEPLDKLVLEEAFKQGFHYDKELFILQQGIVDNELQKLLVELQGD